MCRIQFLLGITLITLANLGWGQVVTPLPADVRVVIDVSGSMKQNDPSNLRQPALELLVQLLPQDSKAGVWTFGRYINMMVPHRLVTDKWRSDATSEAKGIRSLGLFTNIGGALEKAGHDLARPSDKYHTSIILLTDGMVDISRDPAENQKEWRRIIDQVLPRFKQAGYTIHTVALSDNADTELLNKLSLTTDGIAAVAKSADDLMKIFLKAFDKAAPTEQVPLEENRFVVDSSIEEFTALIFRKPDSAGSTRLIGPDREEYNFENEKKDVNWYRSDAYDLITLHQPLEGQWQVLADMDPDSRVTVVSDLKLLVKALKNNIFRGDTMDLSLLLQEGGETITRAEFLQLLDVGLTLTYRENNRVWEQSLSAGSPPQDGIYSATLSSFNDKGHYDLTVSVDGKSFKRVFSHTVTVREPFAADMEKKVKDGTISYSLTVNAYGQSIDFTKTKVVAQIKDPDGRSAIKALQLTDSDNWHLDIAPQIEGDYMISLRVSAVNKDGKTFDYTPEALGFRYPDADDPFSKPVVEQEAVVKSEVKSEIESEIESEPEPEPEPEPKREPEPELKPEPAPETIVKWPLYLGLVVGNLFILAIAFFAYRMIMGGKGSGEMKDLENLINKTEAENAESNVAEQDVQAQLAEKEPPMKEPLMDEVATSSGESSAQADSRVAEKTMDDDLDLATDLSAKADIDMQNQDSDADK